MSSKSIIVDPHTGPQWMTGAGSERLVCLKKECLRPPLPIRQGLPGLRIGSRPVLLKLKRNEFFPCLHGCGYNLQGACQMVFQGECIYKILNKLILNEWRVDWPCLQSVWEDNLVGVEAARIEKLSADLTVHGPVWSHVYKCWMENISKMLKI